MLGEFLAVKRYSVQSAANGSEALEFSKHYQTSPELNLLDLNMRFSMAGDFLRESTGLGGHGRCPREAPRRNRVAPKLESRNQTGQANGKGCARVLN